MAEGGRGEVEGNGLGIGPIPRDPRMLVELDNVEHQGRVSAPANYTKTILISIPLWGGGSATAYYRNGGMYIPLVLQILVL